MASILMLAVSSYLVGFRDVNVEHPHESSEVLAKAAVYLAKSLESEGPREQAAAIQALRALKAHAKPAIPLLIKYVRGRCEENPPEAVADAIRILASFGTDAMDINPELVDLLRAPRTWAALDRVACEALIEIGPDAAMVPLLLDVLSKSAVAARIHAIVILGEYGNTAREAAPAIATQVREDEQRVVYASAYALAQIGGPALTMLGREYRQAEDDARRHVIISALNRDGLEAEVVESVLKPLLDEEKDKVLNERIAKTLAKVRNSTRCSEKRGR